MDLTTEKFTAKMLQNSSVLFLRYLSMPEVGLADYFLGVSPDPASVTLRQAPGPGSLLQVRPRATSTRFGLSMTIPNAKTSKTQNYIVRLKLLLPKGTKQSQRNRNERGLQRTKDNFCLRAALHLCAVVAKKKSYAMIKNNF
jgi:hypothetical protein